MTSDPHVLHPDHLPTPFTADEIRVGCPPGRTVRSLVVETGSEPYVQITRFVSGDAEGAEQESWTETPDGVRLTEPKRRRTAWLGFQGHASMPAATTDIAEEAIDIPAGQENEIARKVLIAHLQSGNSYGIRLKEQHTKFPQPELGPWVEGSKTVGTDYAPPVLEGWEKPAGH